MADFASSLPVRTESAGDVVVKLGDATTPAQQASVDASGRVLARITDTAGNSLTSTGGSLNVNMTNSISVGVADETAFTYGTSTEVTIGGVFQDTSPTLTAGQQGAVRLTSQRAMHHNLRDSSGNELLGQKAMAASIPVVIASNQSAVSVTDTADGPVGAGAAAANSQLAGLVFNTAAPTLTNGQQAAMQGDSSANLLVKVNVALPTGGNTIGIVNQGTAGSAANGWFTKITDGTNTAAVKAASTAAAAADPSLVVALSPNSPVPAGTNQIGAVSIQSGGTANGPSNPLYVSVTDAAGTPVTSYQTSASLAAGASVNLDYTVTAAKTFYCSQLWVSASAKLKVELRFETAAGSGTFVSFWVGFNSTSEPNILIPLPNKTQVASAKIRVVITNKDNQAQDVYETLSGTEV